MRLPLIFTLLVSVSPVVAADPPVDPSAITIDATQDGATLFASVCANCHGALGEGKRELLAPSIAGQPEWFVTLQLEKFQKGHRGAGGESDTSGGMMRAIALALNEETITKIAAHIGKLEPIPTTTTMEGDLELGQELFMETCAACHRYNGQGEKAFRSAPLTRLPDWYIEASLRRFQKGDRGYAEHGDMDGPKMREIAQRLGEEQIPHIIAYIAYIAEKYPPGEERRRGPRQVK